MAAPVVSGIAALLLSYYPELSPRQLIDILTTSSKKIDAIITKPGTEDQKISFNELSKTGGIVNAYEAMKLASKTKGERKPVPTPPLKKK